MQHASGAGLFNSPPELIPLLGGVARSTGVVNPTGVRAMKNKDNRHNMPESGNSINQHHSGAGFWMLVAAIFAVCFAARMYFALWTGPTLTLTYPDEVRFFHIARSLAEHGQILVRGIATPFQKILYPIFISPAFIFAKSQEARMVFVIAINCRFMRFDICPGAALL